MIQQRDLVLLAYPFSDMKTTKVRPVVVISNDAYNGEFEDAIVVPLTTNTGLRKYAIPLRQPDLEEGSLVKESMIKVDRILSIKQGLIRKVIGKVNGEILKETIKNLMEVVKA